MSEKVELIAGLINPDGGEVFHSVTVREMTGVEEDLFTNRKEANQGTLFTTLLSGKEKGKPGVITTIGDIVNDGDNCRMIIHNMFHPDRVKILLTVRAISHEDGAEIYPKLSCPHCGEQNAYMVDVLELPVKKKPDPEATGGEFLLPKSGKLVKYKFLTGKDDLRMTKIRRKGQESLISHLMLMSIKSIEGVEFLELQTIENLPMRDRRALRKEIEEQEGSVDTNIENLCHSCGKDFNIEIDVLDPDFFFGSRDS